MSLWSPPEGKHNMDVPRHRVVHTNTKVHTHTHTDTQTRTHARTHAHTHTRTHTQTHTHKHTQAHSTSRQTAATAASSSTAAAVSPANPFPHSYAFLMLLEGQTSNITSPTKEALPYNLSNGCNNALTRRMY